jgi:gluconolactonase
VSWTFERLAGPYTLTEGPAWDGDGLLFTDIGNDRILRYDPATGRIDVYRTGTEGGNGLMFDREGRLYGCQQWSRQIVRYEPDGSTTVIVDRLDGRRLNSPNDLAIDSRGRVWFSDPRYRDTMPPMELDHHSILRATPRDDGSWSVERVTFDTSRPNGLLVSADDRWLYVAESPPAPSGQRELRAYPIADDGSVGSHQVLHTFGPHRGIDGMCLDVDGNIVATAGWEQSGPGGMIYVFSPQGRVLSTHPMPEPVRRPTNCAFGGPDLRTLYVTDIDGYLHRAQTDHVGWHRWPPRP